MFVNEVAADRLNAQADLAQAEKMHRNGAELEDIHETTGWFPGPDGMFRTEVDNSSFGLTGDLEENGVSTVGEAVSHDQLFDVVPEIKDTPIVVDPNGGRGWYDPVTNMIGVEDPNDIEAIAHEVQHDIQDTLNFPMQSRGTSPEAAGSDEAYMNNIGEVEAFDAMETIGHSPDGHTPDLLEKAEEEGVGPGGPSV